MKAVRDALAPTYRTAGSQALARLLVDTGDAGCAVISAFWAMGSEIDPRPLTDALRARGHPIALPVMMGKSEPLAFRLWVPGEVLVERMWGIREPAATSQAVEPDVLLVPLLAFDRQGHRLGYGGGFYDRTLRRLRTRKPISAIGVAFDEQEIDVVPYLDYDESLDWVLTPSRLVRCSRQVPHAIAVSW